MKKQYEYSINQFDELYKKLEKLEQKKDNMNDITTPFELTDAYKLSHWIQYPSNVTGIYSNFTPRKSRMKGFDKFIFFGLQAFLKDLEQVFQDNFFKYPESTAVELFDNFYKGYFGVSNVASNEQVAKLHRLGYLPLVIKALPEGSMVDHNIPVMTIRSTDPELFWFAQWIETWLSCSVWKPSTSATTAFFYRTIFDKYNRKTSDIPDLVDWQGHDFSMRGMSNIDDASASGAGHLLSFKGSDTCSAKKWIKNYYGFNENTLVCSSVPATEHSVATAFLEDGDTDKSDRDYISNILKLYPTGIVSVVCDTYDFWHLVTEILPDFKDQIMARDGKLVIRPDSSKKTPVEVIIGDSEAETNSPEYKGLVQCLYEIFGGTINSKGYIDLDSHIGAIYGDSITPEYCEAILAGLKAKGFSSNNIVLGIGSFTYQYVTRDTHGIAVKCTAVEIKDGDKSYWRATFKDPKTDNSGKKSAKGFLMLTEENDTIVLHQEVSKEEESTGLLRTVYHNGQIINEQTFDDVRAKVKESLSKYERSH